MKKKRCPECREYFEKQRPLQVVCSYRCAVAHADRKKQQQWRREKREWKEKNKSKNELLAEAQKAFNAYIRERDHADPCISCGKYHEQRLGGIYDAGHYRSVGAAPHLRFDENNCHKQCVKCNRELSGNTIAYRKRLIIKIGLPAVEAIEDNSRLKRYSHDELRQIKRLYKQKLRALQAKRNQEGA